MLKNKQHILTRVVKKAVGKVLFLAKFQNFTKSEVLHLYFINSVEVLVSNLKKNLQLFLQYTFHQRYNIRKSFLWEI